MSLAIRLPLYAKKRFTPLQRALRYGLQAAWNMNEASGQGIDSYGANTLTDNNTVTSAAGKQGTARQFTAANSESLSIANNAALSPGDVDFWIAAWVYMDTAPDNAGVMSRFLGSNGTREYELKINSGPTFVFQLRGASAFGTHTHPTTLSTVTWYFVFAYYDAVNDLITVSVNGAAFASPTAFAGGPQQVAIATSIGATSAAAVYWDGRIDAVAFGKSPPLGIAALATEMRDFLWNGGAGREWPWV